MRAKRLTLAFVTAVMLAATYAIGQHVIAFYVECGSWWTWPIC